MVGGVSHRTLSQTRETRSPYNTLLTDPDAIRARPEKYLSLIMVKKQ